MNDKTHGLNSAASANRGMSLIELMIALVLGVFLMLGIVEIFAGTKATYNMQDGLSRVQENARFATGALSREIRLSGVIGCGSLTSFTTSSIRTEPVLNYIAATADPLLFGAQMSAGIRGYEYTASATAPSAAGAGVYTIPFSAPATVDAAAASWTPSLPNTPVLNGSVVIGTDVLIVRYSQAPLAVINAGFPGTGTEPPAALSMVTTPRVILHNLPAVPNDFLAEGAVYAASDCSKTTVFLGQRINSFTVDAPQPRNLNRPWTGEENYGSSGGVTYLSTMNVAAYYIGVGASGEPSLFRAALSPNAAGVMQVVRDELVEGVESMQILYGTPTAAPVPGVPATAPARDQLYYREGADNFVTATNIANVAFDGMNDLRAVNPLYPNPVDIDRRWRNVRSVKISLLLRSPTEVRTDLDTQTYELGRNTGRTLAVPNATVASVQINPQDDRRLRQVYEIVVQPRNQMAQRALPTAL